MLSIISMLSVDTVFVTNRSKVCIQLLIAQTCHIPSFIVYFCCFGGAILLPMDGVFSFVTFRCKKIGS